MSSNEIRNIHNTDDPDRVGMRLFDVSKPTGLVMKASEFSNHYKRLYETSVKIYDNCYNVELTSKEVRSMIADELRRAYRLGYGDAKSTLTSKPK